MRGQTWHTLRWILSLSKKFALVVPLQTTSVVALTLVAQVCALLASFLPLKVVILLGSEGIPRYFPDTWSVLDRDMLIGLLSVGTLGFFVLHLLAERLARAVTVWGAGRLLARSHKMVLFANQDELAQEAYLRFSRALAAGVFVGLAWLGLGLFYPAMVTVMLAYIVLAGGMIGMLYGFNESFSAKPEKTLISLLGLCGGIGFFVCFAYLVADFIFWQPPGVIVGIVSLLLSRQVMQKLTALVGDIVTLKRQQSRLDALFFHGKLLMPVLQGEKSFFWDMLDSEERQVWIGSLLREYTPWREGSLEIGWHPSGVPHIAVLLVETDTGRYLVKLFDENRSSLAVHEATLLAESLPGLPALPLLGATQVKMRHCLLFSMPDGDFADVAAAKRARYAIYDTLWTVPPSAALQSRYQRSRPSLWQRLTPAALQRLKVATQGLEQEQALQQLLLQLPALSMQLQRLPLFVATPDINVNTLYFGAQDGPFLLNWSRWYLDPVGAGWPIARLAQLETFFLQAAKEHEVLQGVALERVELAALAFALDAACTGQRYSEALDMLPAMLARLAILESLE